MKHRSTKLAELKKELISKTVDVTIKNRPVSVVPVSVAMILLDRAAGYATKRNPEEDTVTLFTELSLQIKKIEKEIDKRIKDKQPTTDEKQP